MNNRVEKMAARQGKDAINAELIANAETMRMLQEIIDEKGEIDPNLFQFVAVGRLNTVLAPVRTSNTENPALLEPRQNIRNTWETFFSNPQGWASALDEGTERAFAKAWDRSPSSPELSPEQRVSLSEAMMNRQKAYQRFLKWSLEQAK